MRCPAWCSRIKGYRIIISLTQISNIKTSTAKFFLRNTFDLIREKGYSVINIDSTVCLEKPKISPFTQDMKNTISSIVGTEPDDIAIKATTTEKLGFTGREEGIVAIAVVLLTEISS